MTQAAQSQLETTQVQPFAERLLSALNDGALCLMVSIGHRTALFDAMGGHACRDARRDCRRRPGLNERYVREWLGAMVTAGVVDVDPASATLSPAAGARGVPDARGRGRQHGGVRAVHRRCSAGVEDDIVECFKQGRRRAVREVPALPRGHGRRQRPVGAVLARVAHPSAGAGAARAARKRDPRARRRVRPRPHHESARRAVPEQPVRRHGSVRRGDRQRARPRRSEGPRERRVHRRAT